MTNQNGLTKLLYAQNLPKSPVSEGFRMLRTNVYLSIEGQSRKTILVTSAVPGEGKSTITANLGVVMAQAGKNVLIIDCDLRNPVIHKYFTANNNRGLSNLLYHDKDINSVIHKTGTNGLSLITSGPIPPNPSEILAAPQMKGLLEQVSAQFDTVLLDTPPVNVVTDAVILASRVEGVLLVLKSESTGIDKIKSAKKQLEMANVTIIGVVLNDVKSKRSDNSYYYYYHRGHERAVKDVGLASSSQAAAAKDMD